MGRLVQATDSVGGTILNGYDELNRLTAQTTALGTVSYEYDALRRRTTMSAPGQAPVGYSYDAASRLTQVVQAPLNPVTFDYDPLGRRTRLTLPNQVSTEYQYDGASRVTALIYQSALGPLGNLTYTYDPAGNRTQIAGSLARTLLPDPITSATYDAANRQLTFGGQTLSYDQNGNLTSDGVNTYTWDARNRLVGITGPSLTVSFTYDALGRRIAKEINGELTEYLYDGADIVEELTDQGSVPYLRSLTIDEPLVREGNEHYLADALGSIVGLTDSAGALATRYVYDPFGGTSAEGTPSVNPFQYTGRENDGTGLYYYRARYYSPALQRFIGEDPIGPLGGDVNFYVYAGNNPLVFTDPLGLDKEKDKCKEYRFWINVLRDSGKWSMAIGAGMMGGGAITGYQAIHMPTHTPVPGTNIIRLNTATINALSRASHVLWGAGAIDFGVGALMYGTALLIEEQFCQ